MQIEQRSISTIRPYENNPRQNDDAVAAVAESIRQFGFRVPIVVDRDGLIIAGHTRLKAALKLGMTEVPVHVAADLTPDQVRALRIADNKVGELVEWDLDKLGIELKAIDDGGLDLDLTSLGFDQRELERLLATSDSAAGGDPDAIPETQEVVVSKPGEIYLLGPHRLMCGDSTSAENWQTLLGGEKADACVTDPPYGIGDTKSDKNKYDTHEDTKENLNNIIAKVHPLLMSMVGRIVLTPGNGNQRLWPNPAWHMAWFTPAGVGSGPWGFCCWQPILCYGKDPMLQAGKGRHPDAIVHSERASSDEHPCAKPISFWCWLLERVTLQGETILEPFGGSGTTIIAAAKTGRVCRAMEISPRYCDVVRRRWTRFAREQGLEAGPGAIE